MAADLEKTESIITPMPRAMVDAIDDYKCANRLHSRAEAICRLIEPRLFASENVSKARHSIDPESETRGGPEGVEQPEVQTDD